MIPDHSRRGRTQNRKNATWRMDTNRETLMYVNKKNFSFLILGLFLIAGPVVAQSAADSTAEELITGGTWSIVWQEFGRRGFVETKREIAFRKGRGGKIGVKRMKKGSNPFFANHKLVINSDGSLEIYFSRRSSCGGDGRQKYELKLKPASGGVFKGHGEAEKYDCTGNIGLENVVMSATR